MKKIKITFLIFNLTALVLSGCGYSQTKKDLIESSTSKIGDGDYEGAIADCNKAIEINPKNEAAFVNRGTAKIQLKDYQGAIEDFNKAMELKPQNWLAYYHRGLAKQYSNDISGALKDYDKAIEINPKDATLYYTRGLLTKKLFKPDGNAGCDDWKKAAELGYEPAKKLIEKYCK